MRLAPKAIYVHIFSSPNPLLSLWRLRLKEVYIIYVYVYIYYVQRESSCLQLLSPHSVRIRFSRYGGCGLRR